MNVRIPALQLEIALLPGATYTQSYFPLRLRFVNCGNEPARILDSFEPLPVFFAFHLVKADGTPIGMPGMGKIDFGPIPPGYIELRAGEAWSIKVDLAGLIGESLSAGTYNLSAIYHNQYGDDCFRGRLNSNVVSIELVRTHDD